MSYSDDEAVEMEQMEYFKNTDGVIQVFAFDYEQILDFHWEVTNNNVLAGLLCPLTWPFAPFHFICGYANMRDEIESRHVCVTRDGIRYVTDKHKTACRLDCQDEGKVTKTVPFDKLTDCDIEEPAGAEGPICCLTNRVLHTVNVDTASGSRGGEDGPTHELTLEGLIDPHGFKETVWRMKRSGGGSGAAGALTQVPGQQAMSGGGDVIPLLERQTQLLEENNALLRQIADQGGR
eukprot:TRINITY_DN1734_c0_g1_i1.p1 TRINITY_DN1734_c0_g1~~TRINITY_DN1734_c0_g1_i1.p1  ORF type:complete len:235 (+),score=39.68 TRINITY_DN1734_c0_g1_i1:110-814(+)